MTATEERYAIERAKWDAHAGDTNEPIVPPKEGEDFASFAGRDALLVGVAEFLGDLHGKQVVEYGCGLGKLTVLLARTGAHVSAFDLSEGSIEVARKRAAMVGVEDRITFAVAPGAGVTFWPAAGAAAVGWAARPVGSRSSTGPSSIRLPAIAVAWMSAAARTAGATSAARSKLSTNHWRPSRWRPW